MDCGGYYKKSRECLVLFFFILILSVESMVGGTYYFVALGTGGLPVLATEFIASVLIELFTPGYLVCIF